jgi:Sec-independent protein translocase protein TatA
MDPWLVGFVVGGAVVLIVVVVLLLMILGARRIVTHASTILERLEEARDNTHGLWGVEQVNRNAERIVEGAAQARESLAGGERH